jgi:hypothetical protein
MKRANLVLGALLLTAACAHADGQTTPPAFDASAVVPQTAASAASSPIITHDPPPAEIAKVTTSPDGARVAVARTDWSLEVHDVPNQVQRWRVDLPGQPLRLLWSEDSTKLGVETHNGVAIYDVATAQRVVREVGTEATATRGSAAMRLSPKLDRLVMVTSDGAIVAVDLATMARHELAERGVALRGFSRAGELLLEQGEELGPSHALLVIDLDHDAIVRTIRAPAARIDGVSEDGGYAAIQGRPSSVVDLATGKVAQAFADGRAVSLAPRGHLALVRDDNHQDPHTTPGPSPPFLVVDLASGKKGAARYHVEMSWTDDGRWLIHTNGFHPGARYNPLTGQQVDVWLPTNDTRKPLGIAPDP